MTDFVDGPIEGVIVRRLQAYRDDRGWLAELFRQDEMNPAAWPVMAYVSETLPGVARGPHEHREQTDLFCFLGPSVFRTYLWDNRGPAGEKPHKMVLEAGEGAPASLIVPPGVVHAYRNIGGKPGWVINCANVLYRGPGRDGPVDEIRHEDNANSPFVME